MAICVLLWLVLLGILLLLGRRDRARELLTLIPDCVVLGRRLLGDPAVPRRAKVALALLVAYLASPVDLIPDFVPVLGYLDDALVAAAVLQYVVRVSGRDTVAQYWPRNRPTPSALSR
jgi:uncharacterized membrane protein YkvA (DUF1232 family)